MKKILHVKHVILIAFLVICLMGINYAWYTDMFTLTSDIATGSLNYSFDMGDKVLHIDLDSVTSNQLLNMDQGETYTLSYMLSKNDSDSIALRNVLHAYLGSISIDLTSINYTSDNTTINPSAALARIPNSLGTYDCYNDFDGKMGTITLVKTSLPQEIDTKIVQSELDTGLLTSVDNIQNDIPLAMEESNNPITADNSVIESNSNDESTTDESKEEAMQEDNDEVTVSSDDNTKAKESGKKEVIVATINIEGTYGFQIPLTFDQFNQAD